MPDSTPSAARSATPALFGGFKPLQANFTLAPNQFFDRIVGHYDPCVVSVVAILIRATLGWEDPDSGERRVEADLPLSAFLRPAVSEQSARRGLAAAVEAGFIVQTRKSGPREAARYALRWEDAEAQKRAIRKQRAAQRAGSRSTTDGPPKRRRGATVEPLEPSRGATVTPLRGATVEPPLPYTKESIKESDLPTASPDKDDTQRRVYREGAAGIKAALQNAARRSPRRTEEPGGASNSPKH